MTKAFLDVSDVLLDPMLASTFDVNRRVEVISNKGRVEITETLFSDVVGVVCTASKNDLDRLDDNQRMGRHLSIVTRFRLRGPSPGYQPDTVVWNGDTFVVQYVDVYTDYGFGFIQAIVGSMDSIDQPPTEGAVNG